MTDSIESFKDDMDKLIRSQLAFYGQIDAQVLEARRNPTRAGDQIIDTVEQLLPQTTGFGQAGWYPELTQFLDRKGRATTAPARSGLRKPNAAGESVQRALRLPTFDQAITTMSEMSGGPMRRSLRAADAHDPVATTLAYPAMVLAKIAAIKSDHGVDHDIEQLTVPLETISASNATIRRSVSANINDITQRGHWTPAFPKDEPTALAERSKPCFGMLEEVNGQYCSAIYTDYPEADLTVDDVRVILNPCNWPECCSFFRTVRPQEPAFTPHKWNRILETIGPEPDEYLIDTALLFYYGELDDGGIYLNYDIDPSKQDDSGLVEVDSGYICVTPLPGGRVRIRTSKQERVNGLSPTATSALACFFGWGQVGRFMLADTARAIKSGAVTLKNPTAFEISTVAYDNYVRVQGEPPERPGPQAAVVTATLPPNFADTVGDARDLATQLVDSTAAVWGRSMSRWLDGLTDGDVTAITRDIGTQFTRFAHDAYQTAARNVKPELTRPKQDVEEKSDVKGGDDD